MCLAPKQSKMQGNLGPIVLVVGVTQALKVLDPFTMQRGEITSHVYWKQPRNALMSMAQATEYTVIDSELTGKSSGRMQQAEVTLARVRDLGRNDERFTTLTHLGNILSAGDTVMGYDFTSAVFNDAETKVLRPHASRLRICWLDGGAISCRARVWLRHHLGVRARLQGALVPQSSRAYTCVLTMILWPAVAGVAKAPAAGCDDYQEGLPGGAQEDSQASCP